MHRLVLLLPLMVLVTGCDGSQAARYPAFAGADSDAWLTYRALLPDDVTAHDYLSLFETSARNHGCSTEHLHQSRRPDYFRGIAASCEDGNIALMSEPDREIAVGCAKPTTQERCDRLFDAIAAAR